MSKKARSESSRVASLIKANKAEFYIADVELDDPTEIQLLPGLVNKTLGKWICAYMLIAASDNQLCICTFVPEKFQDKVKANDWQSSLNINGVLIKDAGDHILFVKEYQTDDAFKLKDVVRANGFKYLSDQGCLGEADSSDEYNLEDF